MKRYLDCARVELATKTIFAITNNVRSFVWSHEKNQEYFIQLLPQLSLLYTDRNFVHCITYLKSAKYSIGSTGKIVFMVLDELSLSLSLSKHENYFDFQPVCMDSWSCRSYSVEMISGNVCGISIINVVTCNRCE